MASDNFDDTNGTALETHDSNWGLEAVDVEIQNNHAQNQSNFATSYIEYSGSNSDYSKITIIGRASVDAAEGYTSPSCRGQGTVNNCYRLRFSTLSGGNWTVLEYYAGGTYINQNSGSWDSTADLVVELAVSDNGAGLDLDVTIDGTPLTTITESTRSYNGGVSGAVLVSNGTAANSAIDDWTDTAAGASSSSNLTLLGVG